MKNDLVQSAKENLLTGVRKKNEREKRLAEALRKNLHRRKRQKQMRSNSKDEVGK